MRTLQLVGDSKYGGATYLILEWCRYLLAHGCEVDVLSTDAMTVSALRDISGVNILGDIYIPREINLFADGRAFAQLLRLLVHENYDVVHTYTATPGMLGRIAACLARVPVVFHHQAAWTVDEFSGMFERLFFAPLEYLATAVSTRGICVSNSVAKHAEDFGLAPRRKLVTIRNGIDSAPFLSPADANALRRELNADADTLIIGATGRLASDKDFPTLLQAACLLRDLLPDRSFVFALIGDGPDRPEMESLAKVLRVHDLVRFLGFRNDIPQLLGGMDVFVTTSLREGLSISVLEAMASARAIVATSIPPNAELIEHEVTGLLVNVRSPRDVAEAIARFVREPELAARCSSSARELVLREYTITRMFKQTWDLYNEFAMEPNA